MRKVEPRIVVVSTTGGFSDHTAGARAIRNNLQSVADQTIRHEHYYISDDEWAWSVASRIAGKTTSINRAEVRRGRGTCLKNLKSVIDRLPADAIVAWVEGDDWLARPDALAAVARAHAEGAWVTFGQFVEYPSYWLGWASDFPLYVHVERDYRATSWRSTHLKTFRAGLFQRISTKDLQRTDGSDVSEALDCAVMFPCLEMAGREHVRFISDVLYVYNTPVWNQKRDETQKSECRRLMALPKYDLLTAL